MTTDVRTLLHDTAEVPSRAPDIAAAMQRARARRRRHRGLGALAAVVVAALVVGALALGSGGGDGAEVAIGPRQTNSEVPEGWKQIQADPGISIAIPPGWDTYDYGHTDVADLRIAVGTANPEVEIPFGCPDAAGNTGAGPDGAWVTVWEYPAGSTSVNGPAGNVLGVGARPATFSRTGTFDGPTGSCDGGAFTEVAFQDAGRVFVARVVVRQPQQSQPELQAQVDALKNEADGLLAQLGKRPIPENFETLQQQYNAVQNEYYNIYGELQQAELQWKPQIELAQRVLDTLHVEPLEGTTTTMPVATTQPIPVISPPSAEPSTPFVPSTTDEQQINDLVVAWLRYHPDDETRSIVEDADALLPSIHEGLAQHSASDLLKYSGTVSAIRMLDADHAEVDYILLFDGRPQFGVRTGIAARINGHWMVSRATECSLLSLGGITCPAE